MKNIFLLIWDAIRDIASIGIAIAAGALLIAGIVAIFIFIATSLFSFIF